MKAKRPSGVITTQHMSVWKFLTDALIVGQVVDRIRVLGQAAIRLVDPQDVKRIPLAERRLRRCPLRHDVQIVA